MVISDKSKIEGKKAKLRFVISEEEFERKEARQKKIDELRKKIRNVRGKA